VAADGNASAVVFLGCPDGVYSPDTGVCVPVFWAFGVVHKSMPYMCLREVVRFGIALVFVTSERPVNVPMNAFNDAGDEERAMKYERCCVWVMAIAVILVSGCPPSIQAQQIDPDPPLDYNGPVYTAQDFWPLAVGNYWLWMNPEDPFGSISKEIIKAQSIKGMSAYLVETIPHVELGTYPILYYYMVDHPKGLFKTLPRYSPDGPGGSNEDLSEWAADPDDLSPLIPVLTGEFIPGTFVHPAGYDPNQKSTVAPLVDVLPLDQCEVNVAEIFGENPEDFLVSLEHLVLLNHGLGACEDGSRTRSLHALYAYGIGPLRLGDAMTLVRVVIDGHAFVI